MSNSWHKVKRPTQQTLLSQKENELAVDVVEKTMPTSEGEGKRQPLMAVKQNANRQPQQLQRPKPLILKQSMLNVMSTKAKENSKENRVTSPTYDQAYMTMRPEKRNRPHQDGSILKTASANSVRQTIDRKALAYGSQKKSSSQRQKAEDAKLAIGRDDDIQDQDDEVRQVRRKANENTTKQLCDSKIKVVSNKDTIRRQNGQAILPDIKCSSLKASLVNDEEGIPTLCSTPTTHSRGEFETQDMQLTKGDLYSTGGDKLKKLKGEQSNKTKMQEGQLHVEQTASNVVLELLEDEAASPFSSPNRRVIGSVESSQLLSSSPSIDEPPTSSTDLLSPDVQYEMHTIYPNPTGKTLTEKLGIVNSRNAQISCIAANADDSLTNTSGLSTPSQARSATIPLSLEFSEFDVVTAFPNPTGKTLLEKLALAAKESQHALHAYGTEDTDEIPSSPSY
ncbi:hypothetical protein INT44_000071 [Umbelopsis vinacea]|uniref:Uncharacterized protein n=1 Tax=Umbelopsis vinacea TaxID=44442 RepID=A0A8H7PHC5_9FUNG|nr:hypothetical protein INT44_000071 [Umbelopsis vinacea]